MKRRKRHRPDQAHVADAASAEVPIRKLLKMEGKLVHGTRGKEGHGPRGNRKYS